MSEGICSLGIHNSIGRFSGILQHNRKNDNMLKIAFSTAVVSLILLIISVIMILTFSHGAIGIAFSVIAAICVLSLIISCIVIGVVYGDPLTVIPGDFGDNIPLIEEEEFIKTPLDPHKALEELLERLETLSTWTESKPLTFDENERSMIMAGLPTSYSTSMPSEVGAVIRVIENAASLVTKIFKNDEGVVVKQKVINFSDNLQIKNLPINLSTVNYSSEELKEYVANVVARQSIVEIGSVPGDGNCFFNSMSQLLETYDSCKEPPDLIRKKCCSWLKDNFRGNPLVCHLLYADIMSAIEIFYQTAGLRLSPAVEDFLKNILIKCTVSYFETPQESIFRPVETVPYGFQLPREGVHPVCDLLLSTYIDAVFKSGVYVGAVMGLAFSQVYQKTVVLYPDHPLLPVVKTVIRTRRFSNRFKLKKSFNSLTAAGFRFTKHPTGWPAVGVQCFPLTVVYGAEFLSRNIFGFVRVTGCHFEPVHTRHVHLKSSAPNSE